MAISYVTLERARITQNVNTSTSATTFDAYFEAVYDQVTARIDQYGGVYKWFAPYLQTRQFNAGEPDLVGDVLLLDFPCISVDSISVAGTTFDASSYTVYTDGNNGLVEAVYSDAWPTPSNRYKAISVTGLWGYRKFYSVDGWNGAVTTLSGDINATVTTVDVTAAANLSVGMLIRVGDEYMSISSISTNELTVERGIRGTTATTHTSGDDVDVFVPQPDIQDAAAKMIAYGYSRRGKYEKVEFDSASGISVQFPPDLPESAQNILNRYRFAYVGAG